MIGRLLLIGIAAAATACGSPRPEASGVQNAAASSTPPAATGQPLDVVELSAADARDRMAAGTLTSRALTRAYLDRIAAIDDAGPRLEAVIELNAAAEADAEALDRERQDAFLVTRLRAAGAVILGKTNLSEWANLRSTRSTSGWSSRGGQTKNPYALDRNPCGSSSGTGAAIAASLAAVGVGTETDGSIMCPSSVNGLVGLKPTVGLVSRSGIIPISVSQDTAGPMARTVADAAMLLSGLAGADPDDPAAPTSRPPIDYTSALKPDALAGKRFGLLRQAMGYHPDVDAAALKAADAIRMAGADVVDVRIAGYGDWNGPELDVLLYEFKDGLNRYLEESGAPHRSLEDLIAWNTANADRVMPYFGQELFVRAQAKGPLTDPAYLKAREMARRLAGRDGLLAALDSGKLDAVIAPTVSPAWPTDYVLGDHFVGAGYGMAAVAGTPSITIPIGASRGLPLGLTFMGRAYSEADLIGYAFALERLLPARSAPSFRPTVEPR